MDEVTDKWPVEMLVVLHSIDQKLGFILQALETTVIPAPEPQPEQLTIDLGEQVDSVDDPVSIKTLSGEDADVDMAQIAATNPKTARAIRIARALSEPFQAYMMNANGEIGIVVGHATKEHIERLRSMGQWA